MLVKDYFAYPIPNSADHPIDALMTSQSSTPTSDTVFFRLSGGSDPWIKLY